MPGRAYIAWRSNGTASGGKLQVEFELAAFDCFTLDTRRRELLANGRAVPLDAKPFDLLAYLIARRADAVTRDEILADVWPGRTVDPGNVAVQLSALRGALKKAGATSNLIVTLPGPRYRFVGDVDLPGRPQTEPILQVGAAELALKSVPVPGPQDSTRRFGLIVTAGSVLLVVFANLTLNYDADWLRARPPPPSLSMVVLPFRYVGADRGQEWVAEAITDDLSGELQLIPGSIVIDRESAEKVRGKAPLEIGMELNVRYIVEGTVSPAIAGYRARVVLTDTQTSAGEWTQTFDIPKDRLPSVSEDIVPPIRTALHFQLDQLEAKRSLHDRPNDPNATDYFLRARAVLDRDDTIEGFNTAEVLLKSALRVQPDFPEAEAEFGWMLLRKQATTDDPDEVEDFDLANDMIRKALHASPNSVKALAAEAEAKTPVHCVEARPYAKKALAIDPSSLEAHTVLAQCAEIDLRFAEAQTEFESILRLNPLGQNNRSAYRALGYILVMEGRPSEAIVELSMALAGEDEPVEGLGDMSPVEQARLMLIAAYQLNQDHADAVQEYVNYAKRYPLRSTFRIGGYFPAKWPALKNFRKTLQALQEAGMPPFLDENTPGPARDSQCREGDFTLSPMGLTGVNTLDSNQVRQLISGPKPPVIIDVGRGVSAIHGAIWLNPDTNQKPEEFAEKEARWQTGSDPNSSIIVVGDGVTGCASYNAAVKLRESGFPNVGWFRGGEEAWADSGNQSEDVRPR